MFRIGAGQVFARFIPSLLYVMNQARSSLWPKFPRSAQARVGLGGALLTPVAGVGTTLPRPYGVTSAMGHGGENHPRRSTSGEDSADPQAEEPDDARTARMRLEAVLLLAKTPLSLRKLSQLAHLADATEARTLVRQLNRTYDALGRAVRIEHVAGGYRLLTRPILAPWLARLGHLPQPIRLSIPMMETLAVVAYRQPVSRASAEAVRGVACGELLRQLMERDLIRIVGRSEELGRPYLYGTTKRFLQLFGLPNADALPPIQWQALQEDPIAEDSPEDLSTSTKEPVVSTSVAPPLDEAEPKTFAVATTLAPTTDQSAVRAAPSAVDEDAVDEDEEDEFFDDEEEDDEEEDWDEDEDDGEDWDDDDLEDDEDDDLDEDDEDDDLDDDESEWKEVDDEDDDDLDEEDDDDLEDDDDEEWDDEDDEDWDEEDGDEEEDEEEEEWD